MSGGSALPENQSSAACSSLRRTSFLHRQASRLPVQTLQRQKWIITSGPQERAAASRDEENYNENLYAAPAQPRGAGNRSADGCTSFEHFACATAVAGISLELAGKRVPQTAHRSRIAAQRPLSAVLLRRHPQPATWTLPLMQVDSHVVGRPLLPVTISNTPCWTSTGRASLRRTSLPTTTAEAGSDTPCGSPSRVQTISTRLSS
jgi:hypothetical protein